MILLVLNDPDRLEELLIAWEEKGVEGATVLFSTGLGQIRQLEGWRDDMPLIPSLSDFYEAPENMNRTIFTTVDTEADVEAVVSATKAVLGELDEHQNGFLLVLAVASAHGIKRMKRT
jgi:hypothetical protein